MNKALCDYNGSRAQNPISHGPWAAKSGCLAWAAQLQHGLSLQRAGVHVQQ